MKSEHRLMLAVGISSAFFVAWYAFFAPKHVPQAEVVAEQVEQSAVAPAPSPASSPAGGVANPQSSNPNSKDPQGHLPIKQWTIKNELVEADFTSDGAVPTRWELKNYHSKAQKDSPLVNLVFGEHAPSPLLLSFEEADFYFPERPRYELVSASPDKLVFRWRSDLVEVTKTVVLSPNSYVADVDVELKNLGSAPLKGSPSLGWSGMNLPAKGSSFLGIGSQPQLESSSPAFYQNGSVHREANVFKIGPDVRLSGETLWSGLESRYFLGAVVPRVSGASVEYGARSIDKETGAAVWAGVIAPSLLVPSGDLKKASFTLYVGPKDINSLKAAGAKLDEAIDYGWFTIIAVPILYVLRFLHSIINNYGIAIILLTILVKLLLHPINVKSLKSMKAMQQLQPKLKELQAKFKDDKQRLNQETMMLFKAHKVNPMGGCLPMLAQFPIYIALYKVLWNSIELFHAPFFWFYKDLSAPDPYFITPILLGVFMVAQQKLTPSASADPAQQKMMMIMPIMFTVFMLFLPVGLVIYILVNTVMSVTQQYMYNNNIGIMELIKKKRKS